MMTCQQKWQGLESKSPAQLELKSWDDFKKNLLGFELRRFLQNLGGFVLLGFEMKKAFSCSL